jgi:2-polyprenyl-6-methoxyphenol hydroxylase-like FAD-dependent oxidoreductase
VARAEQEIPATIGSHAIVIGAGISGLFAAQVVSEFYRHVTVIDRDDLPPDGDIRAGVPQGQHLHALLTSGALAIKNLFPSFLEQLIAEGAPTGDILANGRAYFGGVRMAPAHSGLPGLAVSRPFLEFRLRLRLAEKGNVSILAPCNTVGLIASPDGRTVAGVRVMAQDGGVEELEADLVVDASGRGSHTPDWLAEIGYPQPQEEKVDVDLGYSSCTATLPANALHGDLGIAVSATVANPRGGGMIRTEKDGWMVSLVGYRGAHPPVTPEGFLNFAQTLPVPDIYDALRAATSLSHPVRYRVHHVVRRHYERLSRFPEGLVVLGDAVTSFNPIYGQGMSVAAKQALILGGVLRHGPAALRRARRKIAQASAVAWQMSVSSDLRMPGIEGNRTPLVRLGNAYVEHLYRAAHHDPAVACAFMRVANLVDPPIRIISPMIAIRVLAGSLRHRQATRPTADHNVHNTSAARLLDPGHEPQQGQQP